MTKFILFKAQKAMVGLVELPFPRKAGRLWIKARKVLSQLSLLTEIPCDPRTPETDPPKGAKHCVASLRLEVVTSFMLNLSIKKDWTGFASSLGLLQPKQQYLLKRPLLA
nr:MAG: hypothetical protein H3Bulk42208_000002 [Mitovirus sp.]